MNPQSQCQGRTKLGERCRKRALTGADYCDVHILSDEELAERMRNLRAKSVVKRRIAAEILASRPESGFSESVTLQEVIETAKRALTAKFAHDGSEDYGAQLLACLVILHALPRSMRTTPDQIRAMLEEALPAKHAALAERDPLDFYKNGRKEWIEARLRFHPITGLFVEPIPPFLFHKSEDREAILRDEVPDVSAWKVIEGNPGSTAVMVEKPNGETILVAYDFA